MPGSADGGETRHVERTPVSNILMIVTAADSLELADGTSHPTGFWAEELVVAHRGLTDAGHTVTIATPGGRPAPVDPASLDPETVGGAARAAEFGDYLERIAGELSSPVAIADARAEEVDALVLPGGHGPMSDLARDADLGRLLVAADAAGRTIAPFCHGPAGLLSAIDGAGGFAFAGRRLTAFTDEEERTGGLGANAPWLVAARLRDLGAIVEDGPAWSSHVVEDGTLVTGQNPQSSDAVTAVLVRRLAG